MAVSREAVVQTAEKYVSRGKIEPAIREYRKLLSDNPNDINTLNRIGDLYARIHKIDEAYALIRGVVEKAQQSGEFRSEIPAEFAVMSFYGAIEQVLTGWIFGLLDEGEDAYDSAKAHIVQTICGGLAA